MRLPSRDPRPLAPSSCVALALHRRGPAHISGEPAPLSRRPGCRQLGLSMAVCLVITAAIAAQAETRQNPRVQQSRVSLRVPIHLVQGPWTLGRTRAVPEATRGDAPGQSSNATPTPLAVRTPRIDPAGPPLVSAAAEQLEATFFSPSRPLRGGAWGAGPVLGDPFLFDGPVPRRVPPQPHGIALRPAGSNLYGGLANHLFALGGTPWTAYAMNAISVNPFLSLKLPSETTLTLQSEAADHWLRDQWSLPLSGVVSHPMRLGEVPMQFGAGARYDAEARDGQGDWGLRFVATMQFP